MSKFTLSPNLAQQIDERPLVRLILDISEPMAILTAGLVEIRPEELIDDNTVEYISTLLVDSVASPFPSKRGMSQVGSFFHPAYRDKVNELVDTVKAVISEELVAAEQAAERTLSDSVYPSKDTLTVLARRGNLLTMSYRLGKEKEEVQSDDPYLGLDPDTREAVEEADLETSEEIMHIE